MTTPDTTPASADGNSDAPTASVNNGLGPTEVAHYIVMLGSLLASTGLHRDFGLTSHAADLAPLVLLVTTLSLGVTRAFKHHSAMKFNAAVYLGQLQHVASVVASGGGLHNIKALTAGVAVLNGAIQQDVPVTESAPLNSSPVTPGVDTTPTGDGPPVTAPDTMPPSPPVSVDPSPAVDPTPVSVPVPDPAPAPVAPPVVTVDPTPAPVVVPDPVEPPAASVDPTVAVSAEPPVVGGAPAGVGG
jgi:hypothetical protein